MKTSYIDFNRFLEGFALGADIDLEDSGRVWSHWASQMSMEEQERLEGTGKQGGYEQGMEYKACLNVY